jgi:hypothetical protein
MEHDNPARGFGWSHGRSHLGPGFGAIGAEGGDNAEHRRHPKCRHHHPRPERRMATFGRPASSAGPRIRSGPIGPRARTGRSHLVGPLAKFFDSGQLDRVDGHLVGISHRLRALVLILVLFKTVIGLVIVIGVGSGGRSNRARRPLGYDNRLTGRVENSISAPSQGERGGRGRRHTRRTPWPSTCCSSTTEAHRRP